MQNRFLSTILLIVSALTLLPGCKLTDWFKEKFGCTNCVSVSSASSMTSMPSESDKNASKETVVSMDGKPVVTAEDFEKSLQLLMQTQQALAQVLPFMSEDQQLQLIRQIAENLAAERVAAEYIKRHGLDKTAEYQETSRLVHEAVDRDLAARTFQQELLKKIEISDSEAKAYYDKNRSTSPYFKRPPFMTNMGGVKASEVIFNTEKEAQEFLTKAKKDFDAAVKEAKATVKDLGLVTAQSDIDAAVKGKLVNIKQVPSVELIKGSDNKFHVVKALSKTEPQFAPFEQVKEQVKEMVLGERFQDMFTKEIEKLKKEYHVMVNQDYVKKFAEGLKPKQQPQAQEAKPEPKKAHATAA